MFGVMIGIVVGGVVLGIMIGIVAAVVVIVGVGAKRHVVGSHDTLEMPSSERISSVPLSSSFSIR